MLSFGDTGLWDPHKVRRRSSIGPGPGGGPSSGVCNEFPERDWDHGLERTYSFDMGRLFHLFVLQKFAHRSYAYVGEIRPTVDVSSTRTIESLEEAVRGHLGSHEEFRSWGKSVDGIDFVVHKVR